MRRGVLWVTVFAVTLAPIQRVRATTYTTSSAYSLPPSQPSNFTSPAPVVYGGGTSSSGAGIGNVLSNPTVTKALPLLENLVGGSGMNGVLPGLVDLGASELPANLREYGGLITPALSSILTGGNVNYGSVLSGGVPVLSKLLNLNPATNALLGKLSPALGSLLSGNLNARSLLSTGLGLLGGLFGGGHSVFSTTTGLLGSLFGGGSSGTGVELSGALSDLYTDPITAAINGQIFAGSSAGAKGSSTSTILSETGSVLCVYNSSCLQSSPSAYKPLYATAAGAMGITSPNEFRSRITDLSKKGVRPDAFASKFNSEQNAYYEGNKSDQELARASTEQYLNKAGQEAEKKAILAAQKTAQTLTALSDKCDKTSKSSQELIRCTMKINTAVPSFQSAQIALATNAQVDTQFMKILLGNISSATDGLNRSQDVDRSATAARLFQDVTLSLPVSGRK